LTRKLLLFVLLTLILLPSTSSEYLFGSSNFEQLKEKKMEIQGINTGINEAEIINLPFVERNRLDASGNWFYPGRNLEKGAIIPQEYIITNLTQGRRQNFSIGLIEGFIVSIDFTYEDNSTSGNCDLYLYAPSINISDPNVDLNTEYIAISSLAEGENEHIQYTVPTDGNYTVVLYHTNPPFSTHPSANGTLVIRQYIDISTLTFFTEGEILPAQISTYSDFYWTFPYTSNPIYVSIPNTIDSELLQMIETSSGLVEETSGSPGEDLYVENATFSGDISIFYRTQSGMGFVSLWGLPSDQNYIVTPLQSTDRYYSQTDLQLEFYLLISEGASVDLNPMLEKNGEPSDELIDYSIDYISNALAKVSIPLSQDILEQGQMRLELTPDYSFDFEVKGYNNYFPVESDVFYYRNSWGTTLNTTLVYASIFENETTIENVSFSFKDTSDQWRSLPMHWIEPGIYGVNISNNDINVTSVEWELIIEETSVISTEPIIYLTLETETTEIDLMDVNKVTISGKIEVLGISAIDTQITIDSSTLSSNVSEINLGTISADSIVIFNFEIEFSDTGSFQIIVHLSASNHSPIEETIEFTVTDSSITETTPENTTSITTSIPTTTPAKKTPGFSFFTVIGLSIFYLSRKWKQFFS